MVNESDYSLNPDFPPFLKSALISYVFASLFLRNRIILRLAVELLNKEAHHRDVVSFFSVLFFQAAKRFIVLNWLRRHMHLPSAFYMCQ
mgnify:CR=1 FL=1